MTQRQARTIESLTAEVAALKLRLANRTAQVDLLLAQIQAIKLALSNEGFEVVDMTPNECSTALTPITEPSK